MISSLDDTLLNQVVPRGLRWILKPSSQWSVILGISVLLSDQLLSKIF